MAHLNHKGPDEEGTRTGRELGKCTKDSDDSKLGKDRGIKRRSGGGKGRGLRLKATKLFKKEDTEK